MSPISRWRKDGDSAVVGGAFLIRTRTVEAVFLKINSILRSRHEPTQVTTPLPEPLNFHLKRKRAGSKFEQSVMAITRSAVRYSCAA
jgi:hypothetical protein